MLAALPTDAWHNVGALKPYYYQAASQLGWPSSSKRFAPLLPEGSPPWQETYLPGISVTYDPAPLEDVGTWVKTDAQRIIFIYGERDPWTAGAFDLGTNSRVFRLDVPAGNHALTFSSLPPMGRSRAVDLLQTWLTSGS